VDTDTPNTSILVTGAAGFIGYHLCTRLIAQGHQVTGIDNLNPYYDLKLKHTRLDALLELPGFAFSQIDISQRDELEEVFRSCEPTLVVNLAAQAGVRYSIDHPESYISSNIVGFFNVLEMCRQFNPKCLLYASSSSVYGENSKVPFEEDDRVDLPSSLYAVTKRTDELMAYNYHKIHAVNSIGMRFFTVYGPLGRPDMAYYQFLNRYFAGEPIHIYDDPGFPHDMYRDFTYVDDVVYSIVGLMFSHAIKDFSGHEIINIGNNHPERLAVFINVLESSLAASIGHSVQFTKVFDGLAKGDVNHTYASVTKLTEIIGSPKSTSLQTGLQHFSDWYVDYHADAISSSPVLRGYTKEGSPAYDG